MATKNINAEKIQGNLSITSVSATTYSNLPLDIRVTGGTYSASSSTIIFTNNTGGTFTVTGITATGSGSFTGGTVTGATIFTSGLSANTISATTYQNLPFWSAGSGTNSVVLKNSNSIATNTLALAEGSGTTASGIASHSEGWNTTASGTFSHAEGRNTLADFYASHAEGYNTTANYYYSHAEGYQTIASGTSSHAEGYQTTASQLYSHAEGEVTRAEGQGSHAEGQNTITIGNHSHAEGSNTTANGFSSHSEGVGTTALSPGSHSEGFYTISNSNYSHSEGYQTTANGSASHSEGYKTTATGNYSHAEGSSVFVDPSPLISISDPLTSVQFDFGTYTFVSGDENAFTLQGDLSSLSTPHTVSLFRITSGIGMVDVNLNYYSAPIIDSVSYDSFSDTSYIVFQTPIQSGYYNVYINDLNSIGDYSHAEGVSTTAAGIGSHAEGKGTTAIGYHSHAEGISTIAGGDYSHAEGQNSVTSGASAHAEGILTTASGVASHAGGSGSTAIGNYSFVHGTGSTAGGSGTIVLGNNLSGSNDNTVYVNNLTATTISAVNYLNLPYPNYITTGSSGTYSLKTTNGSSNDATANYAISFGFNTIASGVNSHAEGNGTTASGNTSHVEGYQSYAYGDYSHAEGYQTYAYGNYSHSEGLNTLAIGSASTANGYLSHTGFYYQWDSPYTAFTASNTLIIRGYDYRNQFINGSDVFILDSTPNLLKFKITGTTTYTQLSPGVSGTTIFFSGSNLSSLGNTIQQVISTTSGGRYSHAEGYATKASGDYSHAEGTGTIAIGLNSHAEGNGTKASGDYSHAEGNQTTASGTSSHAEGVVAYATGDYSHAEGSFTLASGLYSHAEGNSTIASGDWSHAEGYNTTASGKYSYASGGGSVANGLYSFVHGTGSTAGGTGTIVFGNNINGTLNNTAYFERGRFIGTGTSSPVLVVSGSVGQLLSIEDNLTADIFNVVDVNSRAILQVFSGDVVTMGNYAYPSYNTTSGMTITASSLMNIVSVPTYYNNNFISYDSVFVDYSVKYSGGARAGNIMIIQSGSTVQFSETSTNDIGNTSVFTFSANTTTGLTTNYINLYLSSTTNTGTIKTIVRAI